MMIPLRVYSFCFWVMNCECHSLETGDRRGQGMAQVGRAWLGPRGQGMAWPEGAGHDLRGQVMA
jgi:hypothetical protein